MTSLLLLAALNQLEVTSDATAATPSGEAGLASRATEASSVWIQHEGRRLGRPLVHQTLAEARALRSHLGAATLGKLGAAERQAVSEALTLADKELALTEQLDQRIGVVQEDLQHLSQEALASAEPYRKALVDAQAAADSALSRLQRVEQAVKSALALADQAKKSAASTTRPALEGQLADGVSRFTEPLQAQDMRLSDEEKRGMFWFELGLQPQALLVSVDPRDEAGAGATGHDYWPNTPTTAWFEVGYDVWSIELAQSFGDAKDTAVYGKTTFTAIAGERTLEDTLERDLNLRVYYQRYRGFYLHNAEILRDGDPPRARPDLGADYVGVNARWFLNRDFSYLASLQHARREAVSIGSFYARSAVEYGALSANGPLVIPSQQAYFGNEGSLRAVSWLGMALGIGYVYELVLGPIHVSPTLSVGLGGHAQRSTRGDESDTKPSFGFAGDARLALGYYGDHLRLGLDVTYDASTSNLGVARFGVQHIWATLFAGGRF